MHGDIKGGRDSNGKDYMSGDVGGSYRSDSGWFAEGNVGVSGSRDRDGKTRGEVHGGVGGGLEFYK